MERQLHRSRWPGLHEPRLTGRFGVSRTERDDNRKLGSPELLGAPAISGLPIIDRPATTADGT
jgi:hypothetical protein